MFEWAQNELKLARAKAEAKTISKEGDEETIKAIYIRMAGLVLDKPIEEKIEEAREEVVRKAKEKARAKKK